MELMENFLVIKNEQPICQFCNKKCVKGERETKRWWWWICNTCDVSYLTSLRGELSMMEFKSPIQNDKQYTVHLALKSKTTSIYACYNISYFKGGVSLSIHGADIIKTFNHLLDVTPQNFQNKLQTILTFL